MMMRMMRMMMRKTRSPRRLPRERERRRPSLSPRRSPRERRNDTHLIESPQLSILMPQKPYQPQTLIRPIKQKGDSDHYPIMLSLSLRQQSRMFEISYFCWLSSTNRLRVSSHSRSRKGRVSSVLSKVGSLSSRRLSMQSDWKEAESSSQLITLCSGEQAPFCLYIFLNFCLEVVLFLRLGLAIFLDLFFCI